MTDAKALAERLRDALRDFAIGHEAADLIEQQAAEITRLDARRAAIYSAEQAQIEAPLRAEIARQRDVIGSVNSRCDHLGMRLGEVIRERDALEAEIAALRSSK